MRDPLIGGSHHGTFVVVTDPPLERIELAGEPTGFGHRATYRVDRYRLTHWIDGGDMRMPMRAVYLHTSMPDTDAPRYVNSWFETGAITPLEVPSA